MLKLLGKRERAVVEFDIAADCGTSKVFEYLKGWLIEGIWEALQPFKETMISQKSFQWFFTVTSTPYLKMHRFFRRLQGR